MFPVDGITVGHEKNLMGTCIIEGLSPETCNGTQNLIPTAFKKGSQAFLAQYNLDK